MELSDRSPGSNGHYARSLARAFGGAIIFGLPLLMTMELWWMGFHLDRWRLFQFIAVNFLLLIGTSRVSGFEPTVGLLDDVLDALSAYAIGVLASALVLFLFGVLGPGMGLEEIAGKVAIQSVPASFGAVIAAKQLGASDDTEKQSDRDSYPAELFMMAAGALFLAFNVAPTEEVVQISFMMKHWHGLALILASVALLHVLVYNVGFRGEHEDEEGGMQVFLRFTLPGYAIAVLVSLYILWTFGRTEGVALPELAAMVAVLAFPASIGAAIARLVL